MNSPHLLMLLALARQDDLRRAADAHNRRHRPSQAPRRNKAQGRLALRAGSPHDEGALGLPAAPGGTAPRAQPILLAEVDGQLCTALSLADGTVVVDPLHLKAGLIELLRERSRQLEAPSQTRSRRRFRRSPEGSSR